ncbi:MAG: DNA/RNA nuclease SfsA [Anaerovoracaceae bacterium]
MKYINIIEGNFISRPNRFIAKVLINGKEEMAHVKNTGRCKELLTDNAKVYLEDFEGRMGTRKMRYSLIGVEKNNLLINMDSQAPNKVVEEALCSGKVILQSMGELSTIKREKTYGDSRFDFYLENKEGKRAFLEVKGVTLEENGVVRFPDAPTERGVKHINELIKAKAEGYSAYVFFVIQMEGVKWFEPNNVTHAVFGQTLALAEKKGVHILAYDCKVTRDTLILNDEVAIKLL